MRQLERTITNCICIVQVDLEWASCRAQGMKENLEALDTSQEISPTAKACKR